MSENVIEIKNNVLDAEKSSNEMPVLLDFWATWCNPCRMIAPMIEDIAKEYKDKVIFHKINVEENSEITKKYNISSVPTIIIINKEQLIKKNVGTMTKKEIKNILDELLK